VSEERNRWGGPSPWAGKDSRTDAQKLGDADFMAAMHRMRDSFCRAKDGLRAFIPEEAYDALVGEFFDGYAEAKRLYGIGRTEDEGCTCCQVRNPRIWPLGGQSECAHCGHLAKSHQGRAT